METLSALKQQIADAEQELETTSKKLIALRKQLPPVDVTETKFVDADSRPVPLSDLFGGRDELMLVHNMGGGCAYCTLWADGLNGVLPYLEDRTAFAVLSDDSPAAMGKFAASRGWKFRMVSAEGSSFAQDLGVAAKDGSIAPGVSILRRSPDGRITSASWAGFGPGDLYCSVWHLFDLLPDGPGDWEPNYQR